MTRWIRMGVCAAPVSLAALISLSCTHKIPGSPVANARPTVRITAAPIDTTARCTPDPARSCYSLTIQWVGNDPDGRVDHYLYSIDPPTRANTDTVWTVSRSNEERLLFSSREPVPVGRNELPIARDFHVFVIKAVDDRGESGPVTARSFFSYTQAPDVFITSPLPSSLSTPLLVSSVRISWTGGDADGVFNTKPVKYKYHLFSGLTVDTIAADPDLVRRRYGPGFSGWDSVGGDTMTAHYTNLSYQNQYLFVVVGFDEAGAYSPILTLDTNMLRFMVGLSGVLGPKITAFNEYFNYTWRGGWCPGCPRSEAEIEVPANTRVRFEWFAQPPIGATIRCYRWGLDLADVNDDTEREDPSDVNRWSACGINNTSATLGPFVGSSAPDPPEFHLFYISAEDDLGLRSLATIRFRVVRASLASPMLVVKDMRLTVDALDRSTGCVSLPRSGFWPIQSELDTFLFARGGKPWRCLPPGTRSPRGIFADYSPDTIGTRVQFGSLRVPLSKLGQYQHVVWLIDAESAGIREDIPNSQNPPTALRFMTGVNEFNTLAAYVKQGGKVWLTGGGGGVASTRNGEVSQEGNTIYPAPTALRPGRLMHDLTGWRSQFRTNSIPADPQLYAGRYRSRPGDGPSAYTRHLAELPARMEFKTAATDPLPPTRTRPSDFYPTRARIEVLDIANHVLELAGDPESPIEVSVLDTIYAEGGQRPSQDRRIVMTYYHGSNVPQGFVFSGFDVWSWKRSQCQALVDFVLTRIWNLPRPSRELASPTAVRPETRETALAPRSTAAAGTIRRPVTRWRR